MQLYFLRSCWAGPWERTKGGPGAVTSRLSETSYKTPGPAGRGPSQCGVTGLFLFETVLLRCHSHAINAPISGVQFHGFSYICKDVQPSS